MFWELSYVSESLFLNPSALHAPVQQNRCWPWFTLLQAPALGSAARIGFYISTESIFKPFLTFILRTFLSSTCSLSLSRPYLDLDGVNHPIWPARFRKPTRPRLCLPSHSTLASFHVLGSKPSLTAADHTHWAWCLTMKKRCKTGRNELRQSLKKAHSRPAFAFWLQYNQNENQNALAFWLAFWLQNVDTASQRR